MTDEQAATVQIGDGWPPALPDDTYTLTVKQAATPGAGAENDYTATYTLTVAGPRFSIGPDDLHSRFPPPGSTSTYNALLPQAVLTRATLPWERALTGPLTLGTLPTPFIALLVLSGSAAPAVQPGKVNDLVNPPPGTVGPAVTPLEKWESGDDACSYVDMDWDDFTAAVPKAGDLDLLAHLRQGDPATKALGESTPDGWYSVVIANRFPAASQPSTAYLVSLEGLTAYFPPAQQPQNVETVRLAVLTAWSFTDDGGTELAFTTSLQNVAKNSGGLTLPPLGSDEAANAVLAQGYVPMAHSTRQAETVASFYRGPLTPLSLDCDGVRTYSCSDAALRFDPATGMLDVSYAAAWQLGRLLALNDLEVAQAIYQWRRSHVERATRLAGRMLLARRFPSLRLGRDPAALLRGHAVRRGFARVLAEDLALGGDSTTLPVVRDLPPAPRRDTLQPAAEHAALLRAFRADPRNWLGLLALDDDPIPDVVTSWLGRVQQLYGLPFNLLVPDARELPQESIRFFFLDPGWIGALTDGALSVGRTTTLDAEHDEAVAALVHAAAGRARNAVRAHALGRSAVEPSGAALSGFLLRSAAIASWRGVEIDVYADAARTTQLPFVRLDRVSDNVLLCIVDGTAAAVRFKQPIEGLQFGVETITSWNVGLRGLDVNGKPAGQGLNVDGNLTVGASRVLDAVGSATALATDLVNAQAWTNGKNLTSGDFAVQLLENSQIVDMTVTASKASAPRLLPRPETLLGSGHAALKAFVARELSDD